MRNLVLTIKKYISNSLPVENTLIFSLICYCIAVIHAIITVVFVHFSIIPLSIYNSIITLIYIFIGRVLIPRNAYVTIYLFGLAEILFHSIFVSILVGWDWGFMIYTIALVPVGYYMTLTIPQMRQNLLLPIVSTLLIFLCFIVTKTICSCITPVHANIASKSFVNAYYCFNVLITFLMLLFFSVLFSFEIKQMQNQLIQEKENLDIIANHDPLTQLLNRRSMEVHLTNAIDLSAKTGAPFSVILADIDHFKKINDTYGHGVGDQVLVQIAQTIRSQMRGEDFSCRWGGEEFLLLIHSSEEVGMYVAERIRRAVESIPILADEKKVSVTMTFGVSGYKPEYTKDKLIQIADQRLYKGKKTGRNQVVS